MNKRWRVHLAVLGGYILLSLLITWPLVLHFTTALPGEGTDSWQYLWNFWWFDQALFRGQPLYFTDAQYYPLGTSLLFHTLSPLNSALGLPARLLGGYPAAYNFVVMLSTVLSGYGTFLLVLEVLRAKGSRPAAQTRESSSRITSHSSRLPGDSNPVSFHFAAFVAGVVFALSPYRSAHLLGHLSLVSTETLPFFALFAWRTIRGPGWKAALGVALAWLAATLIDWYYPLYMVLLAGFLMLWALGETLLKRRTWREWLQSGLYLGGAFLLAAVVLAPLLVPMLRQARQATYLEEPLSFSTAMGADLAAFVLPGPQHPLWGHFFARWTDPFADGNTAEGIVYLGVVVLILAAVGLWRNWRRGCMWAALAGMFGLLSLGPYLKVLHHNTGVPLPYWLLSKLPIVSFTRVPSRYVVWVQLGLAVLVGLGVAGRLLRGAAAPPAPPCRGPAAPGPPHRPISRSKATPTSRIWPVLLNREQQQRHTIQPNSEKTQKNSASSAVQSFHPGKPRRSSENGQTPWRAWPAILVLALILVDYAVMPFPMTSAAVPAFYQELAQDKHEYALLELPLQRPASPWYYTEWMLHQTAHGKDSFRGYISRGDPLLPFGGAPFLRQLAGLGDHDITYDNWRPLAAALLSHYRVGYVVLEKRRLEEQGEGDHIRQLVREVLGVDQPAYGNDELEAYAVPWGAKQPLIVLGNGWHEVEEQSWGAFRWMEQDRSTLYVILPEARRLDLAFQAVSFLCPRRLEVVQNEQVVATLEISTTLKPYSVPLDLPAGETRLELRADGYDVPREAGAGEDTRAVSVGFSAMRLGGPEE